jgi:FkbM family methyltransferase
MRGTDINRLQVSARLKTFLSRSDLRQRPIRGIYRRLVWRLRWRISSDPWLVRRRDGLALLLPHGGAAAMIYFQGASEPGLANFIRGFLNPGMVFVDVGAHLGEYTVLAASIVGDSGHVHAFEARPDTFDILTRNVEINGFRNVVTKPCAVWNEDGFCEFEETQDPSVSALRPDHEARRGGTLVRVKAVTLDHYFSENSFAKPNLIKIDVEGAELQVLKGASALLSSPQSPVLVVEYGPRNASTFGYHADETCQLLRELGYEPRSVPRGGARGGPGKAGLAGRRRHGQHRGGKGPFTGVADAACLSPS